MPVEKQHKQKYKTRVKRRSVVKGAGERLKRFRQASSLAVVLTGFLLLLSPAENSFSDSGKDHLITVQQENADNQPLATTDTLVVEREGNTEQARDEAITALQNLWDGFVYNYPKILIAIGCLLLTWLLARLIKLILRRTLKKVPGSEGIITLTVISLWLLAVGVVFSVIAGDIRALVGSFGLIGLALSWALQTPIESFTGWLLNSFRGYYKVGDRVKVGEVFGDVYKIDFLSTTVWEIGSPYQQGFVNAEQPTGRLITFPNNEVLTGTVINLTGDFPFVWDEVTIAIANESDIPFAMKTIEEIAIDMLGKYMYQPAREYAKILGNYMLQPASQYSNILKKASLSDSIPDKPQLYLSITESWTDIIIRYLVGVRERRKWKSSLLLKCTQELNKPEYKNRIKPVYPRQQLQLINTSGSPVDINDKV